MKLATILIPWATVLSATLPVDAVPIGTTPDTRPAAPQQRKQWKDLGYGLEFSGNFLQGNVSLANVSAALSVNANQGPHQFFADAANLFTQAGTNTVVNRLSGSALYAYGVRENLNVYSYATNVLDQATNLNSRLTGGAGICLHRIAAPDFSLFLVSLGPAVEREWFRDGTGGSAWRSVLRVNAVRPLSATVEVGADSFYTPAVQDMTDFRLYAEAFLRVKLSEALSLKLTAADEYDSRPPTGIQNNDYGVFTSLAMEWGR